MASLKPEDAESGKHARMSSLAMAHSFSAVSEDGDDGKEENPFKSMEEDVGKMISNVEVIHKIGQKNFKNVVNLINSTFDEMQKTIDEQRKELLKMISIREVKKHGQLEVNLGEFKKLQAKLKAYSAKYQDVGIKEERECQRACKALIYDTLNNDSSFSLKADMEELKASLNKLVKVDELNNNELNYALCEFDEKCSELTKNSVFDEYHEYIKIGKNSGHCYANVKCGVSNKIGYNKGKHCWRLYCENDAKKAEKWLFYGLNEFGAKPDDKHSYQMKNAWGIAGFENYRTYQGGEQVNDQRISFLYDENINTIDMFVDFDESVIFYTLVSDEDDDDDGDDENRKIYKLEGFNKDSGDLSYCVHFNLYSPNTQVQVAKIDVRMFGKNSNLVQWPKQYALKE